MRDRLPEKCRKYECGVINLDSEIGLGTHWVGYHKMNKVCYYFDSFGDLQPPREFITYIGDDNCVIYFNYKRHQKFDSVICGHLCLKFLFDMTYKINIQ